MAPQRASLRHRTVALIAIAGVSVTLAACTSEGTGSEAESSITPTTGVATTAEAAESEFEISDEGEPKVTNDLNGQPVEDPQMAITYHWQGTRTAPNGGTIVTVAVENTSESPMPPEALGTPTLAYRNESGGSLTEVNELSAENAGFDRMVGLDQQLGAGATTNLFYLFDTANSMLWDADFTIGNVTFSGNLNN